MPNCCDEKIEKFRELELSIEIEDVQEAQAQIDGKTQEMPNWRKLRRRAQPLIL